MPGYHVVDARRQNGLVDGPTVREYIIRMLEWKQAYNVYDRACDEMLQFVHSSLLQFSNNYPKSWYLISSLVQPEDHLDY